MKPWMTAAMLVPGHDFGWESPDTVETLLPEWYRDPATGYVEILPSISGDKRYQEKWINAINALPSEMVLIFRNIPQCFFDPL